MCVLEVGLLMRVLSKNSVDVGHSILIDNWLCLYLNKSVFSSLACVSDIIQLIHGHIAVN